MDLAETFLGLCINNQILMSVEKTERHRRVKTKVGGGALMKPFRHRILVLHGYTQCASVLQERMRPLTKKLADVADFIFLDAPFIIEDEGGTHAIDKAAAGIYEKKSLDSMLVSPAQTGEIPQTAEMAQTTQPMPNSEHHCFCAPISGVEIAIADGANSALSLKALIVAAEDMSQETEAAAVGKKDSRRQWWSGTAVDPVSGDWCYGHGARSLGYVIDYIERQSTAVPFTGALGFSQGGSVLQLLPERVLTRFSYLIFIGSWCLPRVRGLPASYTHSRTLHVAGSADNVVEEALSRNLCRMYPGGRLFVHDKVHCVPTNCVFAATIREFISECAAKI